MSVRRHLSEIVLSMADAIAPPKTVWAHCDIPCGIYDPHEAQISALTVLRMDQLIGELAMPTADAKPEERAAYVAKLARYTAVKESHSERVKSEVRVIWSDYFTPDHLKQHPQVHDVAWKILKQASKTRQGTALADAQELVKQVQEFAELFWTTKGAKTRRQPSMQKSGGELVLPVPSA
ncbi:MAG TPA: superoxide dismutase, Ni [Thermoplasmata archaeon]|nr:superoxide dismutase, Ni [Thermoplasmata archaeon]